MRDITITFAAPVVGDGPRYRARQPAVAAFWPTSGASVGANARMAAKSTSDRLDRGHSCWLDRAVPLGPDTDIEALASVIVISAILGNQERLACRRARAQ